MNGFYDERDGWLCHFQGEIHYAKWHDMARLKDCVIVTMDDGAEALVVGKGDDDLGFQLKEYLIEGIKTLGPDGAVNLRLERRAMTPDEIREFQG